MINFFRADIKDITQLKSLWLGCFDDTKEAVDLFFDENFGRMRAFCAKYNDQVVSALYLLDVTLNDQKAHYLCGASTKENYRKSGVMSGLIQFALETARQDGDKFSALMPANASLYNYYARFGYKTECFAENKVYSRDELLNFNEFSKKEVYDFEQLQTACFKNDFLLWNNEFGKFACDYYRLYGVGVILTGDCFAFFEENDGCAEVLYAASASEGVLAKRLLENSSAERFIIISKAKSNSNREKYGMIKSLDDNMKIPNNVFIGITLM